MYCSLKVVPRKYWKPGLYLLFPLQPPRIPSYSLSFPAFPNCPWPDSFILKCLQIPFPWMGLKFLLAQTASGLIFSLSQVKDDFVLTFFYFHSTVFFPVTPALSTLYKITSLPSVSCFPFLLYFSHGHLCHVTHSVYVCVCMYGRVCICMSIWLLSVPHH